MTLNGVMALILSFIEFGSLGNQLRKVVKDRPTLYATEIIIVQRI